MSDKLEQARSAALAKANDWSMIAGICFFCVCALGFWFIVSVFYWGFLGILFTIAWLVRGATALLAGLRSWHTPWLRPARVLRGNPERP